MVKKFEKQIRRTKEENADSAKAHNAANDDLTGDGLVDMVKFLAGNILNIQYKVFRFFSDY